MLCHNMLREFSGEGRVGGGRAVCISLPEPTPPPHSLSLHLSVTPNFQSSKMRSVAFNLAHRVRKGTEDNFRLV